MTHARPPRQRRKDARPDEILAAARQEFADHGFGRSSLAAIAARAGVARTTVYLYYDSKEALFEAMVRATIENAIDGIQALLAPGADRNDTDFRSLFARALDLIYARLVTGDAALLAEILIAESASMPEMVAFYRHQILAKGERVLRALIEHGIARGDLAPACRDEDVRLLIAPALFAALWLRVFQRVDPLDVEAFKSAHVRMVTDALAARR